jgi:hypothetical protein
LSLRLIFGKFVIKNNKQKESKMKNLKAPKSSIADAASLFKEVIKDNEISNIGVKGWEKEVILPYMIDKKGWIGTLMLKSDEVAVMLFGCRIWDVVYTADQNSVDGILPISTADKAIANRDISSYEKIPLSLAGDKISKAMLYLICNYTLKNNLLIKNKAVEIAPVVGFYETNGELKHGSILPFPSETIISAQFLNKFICEMNVNKVLEKTKDLEMFAMKQ